MGTPATRHLLAAPAWDSRDTANLAILTHKSLVVAPRNGRE
jgi:hypothetical protein